MVAGAGHHGTGHRTMRVARRSGACYGAEGLTSTAAGTVRSPIGRWVAAAARLWWWQRGPVGCGRRNVTAIAGGGGDGYALRGDGTVWAWGYGTYGELGNGSTNDSAVPVQVSGLTNVTAIAGGAGGNGYALRSDGTLWAWGYGTYGGLGNGSTNDTAIPVHVSGLTNVTAVAGGLGTGYAVRGDGTVWAWGWGYNGQLGNGSTNDSAVPVQVSGLTNAVAVAGGASTGYALIR
jgi:alpha-tubulin suppressor-like RCC1 family protein